MQCPNCSATTVIGDRFCEECGTPLSAKTPIIGCTKCGAASEAIDAEGFCAECGFRSVAKESDHIETSCGANLGGVSDRGLRHHTNEDYLNCAIEPNAYILVVCDGVSSSQSPELASKAAAIGACESLRLAIGAEDFDSTSAMKQAVRAALANVCAIPYNQSTEADPPSTTFVCAIVQNGIATIGWLGDSRAYWISSNGSRQLTKDDSWLNEVVAAGEMTETQAQLDKKAHAITHWIGADANDNAQPSIMKFQIPGAGYLLLCTDGLWNYAPDASQIMELVKEFEISTLWEEQNLTPPKVGGLGGQKEEEQKLTPPKVGGRNDAVTISRHLVDFARHSGGRDNITVAILSC